MRYIVLLLFATVHASTVSLQTECGPVDLNVESENGLIYRVGAATRCIAAMARNMEPIGTPEMCNANLSVIAYNDKVCFSQFCGKYVEVSIDDILVESLIDNVTNITNKMLYTCSEVKHSTLGIVVVIMIALMIMYIVMYCRNMYIRWRTPDEESEDYDFYTLFDDVDDV